MFVALAFFALIIELMVGYPDRLVRAIGHPVIWIGKLINLLDHGLNRARSSAGDDKQGATGSRIPGVFALIILLAVVGAAAFAVAGGLFYGLALERSATLERMLVPGVTREALAPVVSAGQTFEVLGWAGFGLAAGAGVTALVMFLVGAPPAQVSFFVTPSGLGARGAF